MRLLLPMCFFLTTGVFCETSQREFVRVPGPEGYELVTYKSTKFGPVEYTAKIFFDHHEVAYFVDCIDDYENATLFKLKCSQSAEILELEIQWGNADTATQMHGAWLKSEQSIIFKTQP